MGWYQEVYLRWKVKRMNRNGIILFGLGILMLLAVLKNIDFDQTIKADTPPTIQAPERLMDDSGQEATWDGVEVEPATLEETEGTVAPSFALNTLEGKPFQYPTADKKASAIVFWASWCGNCKALAPNLQQVYEKYADQIEVVGVNVSDDLESAKEFTKRFGFTFSTVFDEDIENSVANQYEVSAVPTLYFVDGNGKVVDKQLGTLMVDELDSKFKRLLNQ